MVARVLPAIGTEIHNCRLTECLSDGSYFWVWSAEASGARCIIKIAKPVELQSSSADLLDAAYSQALLLPNSGNVLNVDIDGCRLIQHQYDFLSVAAGCGVQPAQDIFEWQGLCCLQMSYLQGSTLRELINRGAATLEHVERLLEVVGCFKEHDLAHGDIKPDNIIVIGEQLYPVDCGYFGEMTPTAEENDQVIFTTPLYYPYLEANDLWASGAVLWEVLTGQHPLKFAPGEGLPLGPRLAEQLEFAEATGRRSLAHLRNLQLPAARLKVEPAQAEVVNEILLKALGLKLDGGALELGSGYRDAFQLHDEIYRLKQIF